MGIRKPSLGRRMLTGRPTTLSQRARPPITRTGSDASVSVTLVIHGAPVFTLRSVDFSQSRVAGPVLPANRAPLPIGRRWALARLYGFRKRLFLGVEHAD